MTNNINTKEIIFRATLRIPTEMKQSFSVSNVLGVEIRIRN